MGSKMSNNIKVKSYTIEQDGVEMELVVGKLYQFSDNGNDWTFVDKFWKLEGLSIVSDNGDKWERVGEIKAPEMRPMTTLEAIEHLSVLSRTETVLARIKGDDWTKCDDWTPWSNYTYLDPNRYEYCTLCEGKLGEPKKLEIEV